MIHKGEESASHNFSNLTFYYQARGDEGDWADAPTNC